MTTGHVFIAISLDGYIARDDGDISWLQSISTEGEDHGYQDFMAGVDGLIMGRETFQKVLEFETWPYSKPVVVMSQSLRQRDVPSRLFETVHVNAQPPGALLQSLSSKGWKRAYVDGGQLIQSFMKAGTHRGLNHHAHSSTTGSWATFVRPLVPRPSAQPHQDHGVSFWFGPVDVSSSIRCLKPAS